MVDKINIVSRKSNLALIQVKELMKKMNINHNLIAIDSLGDKDKKTSLLENPNPDIFTRELDQAILNGDAEIAIHSAKDLPYPLPVGIEVIALIEPFDQTDSLVSKNNLTLETLPQGAVVGTSSMERKRQILEARPDFKIFSIRGTIEERIAQVDNGTVDTLIVATCALKRLGLENRIAQVLDFDTHPLQGILAVTAKRNRLKLKEKFKDIDIKKNYGKVSLIGFGPGDPELLTLKANRLLEEANVIFYDALIPENLLSKYKGEKIFVGKRKGEHSLPQNEINKVIYKAAISGKNVARLKGGDPFIFGRGGEELDYLKSLLIDVEVVPGITAAQGAGAYGNIPLTYRGYSKSLTLNTGHIGITESELGTQVFYMGGTKLTEISNRLLEAGYDLNTPVSLIENATRPNQWITTTTVENIANEKPILPVIVIAGDVNRNVIQEKYILNTGLKPKNYGITGNILHQPLIKIERIDYEADLNSFETILFTSPVAVNIFIKDHRVEDIKNKNIISIGPGTSSALEKYELKPDFVPSKYDSETLIEEIDIEKFGKIIYPASRISKNKIHNLEEVTTVYIYDTKPQKVETIPIRRIGGIIFSSPSTVDSFIDNYKEIPDVDIFVFGKFTEERVNNYKEGLNVQTIPL